jgi:hypothetical protein
MTRTEIEAYFADLNRGRGISRLPSDVRKQLFQHLIATSTEFSAKRFQERGLKGTFGLSNLHRERIAAGIKASWAKRKGVDHG